MDDVRNILAVDTMAIDDVIYREDLYPRLRVEPTKIEEYVLSIDLLPPIEVNQDNILIDGMHRMRAYEAAGRARVPFRVTRTKSDDDILFLAIARNASHGLIMSQEAKKSWAVKFCLAGRKAEDVISLLKISPDTWERWTEKARESQDAERLRQILDLHLRCHTQQEIADRVRMPRESVRDKIADFGENPQMRDSAIFRNFEHEDSETSGRRIYDIWNFSKAENEVRHFGNIPPQIVDNLIYLYTKPFDVVFDPFGGGGSTFDVCHQRKRRCWISDLTPRSSRKDDIHQHDVTTGLGLPDGLVPDLVFLDPPYWKQAEEKYSTEPTDLGNVDLETFLTTLAGIAKAVKRRWSNAKSSGHLAVICGAWLEDGEKVHLPVLIYERIAKYLDLAEWITVPYSTQVHGGAFVKRAKEQKQLLYLNRHLLVFRHG